MSNVFNLKYLMENSPSIEKEVIKDTVLESYLNTTIAALQEMNALIKENTNNLYSSINEADSKSAENKLFAEYFYQFKDIFTKFVNSMSDMRDRFIITIDNTIDNNSDLIDDDQYISDFTGSFSYSGWEFKELSNPHFPRMNLRGVYQKDFDYLGKVMQDKGINASPTERIKIIASVCNDFSKCGKNGKWVSKMLEDMIGDDNDDEKSISEVLYKAFREKKDIEVGKGELYSAKEELINLEDYKNLVITMCNSLIADVQFVANDISSYLFRNEDNKLHIQTQTDGVIDRDYRLDSYSMNQVDIFMKSKTSYISKVLNIYTIALGIKIDAIVDSINQSKDILRSVKECNYEAEDIDNISDDQVQNPDDGIDDDQIQMDDGPEQPDENQNPDDSQEMNDEDFTLDDHDDTTDNSSDISHMNDDDDFKFGAYGDSSDESNSIPVPDEEKDELEECALFEASLFEIQLMYENYETDRFVRSVILNEADEEKDSSNKEDSKSDKTDDGNNDKKEDDNKNNDKDTNNVNAKPPLWLSLMRKLSELWKKFKEIVIVQSKRKIEYLKSNESKIKKQIQINNIKLRYTPKIDLLQKISIPELDSVKDSLEDEPTLLKKMKSTNLGNIDVGSDSIANAIQDAVLGEEQTGSTMTGGQPKPLTVTIMDAYNFCVSTYSDSVKEIQKSTKTLEKAQDRAIAAAKGKINESASFDMYFNELDTSGASSMSTNKEDEKETRKQNKQNFDVYFKVCSNILSAKMSIYQKLFNEFYSYCKYYIGQVEKGGSSSDKSSSSSQQSSEKIEKVDMGD